MRVRSSVTAITIAALASTALITPAHAFTDVVTQSSVGTDNETTRSCTLVTDENLSPAFYPVLGIVTVTAKSGETAEQLPFASELIQWYEDPDHGSVPPADLVAQMEAAGYEADDASGLIEAIRAYRVLNGKGELSSKQHPNGLSFIFNIFFSTPLPLPSGNTGAGFSYFYERIKSESDFTQAQQRFANIQFDDFKTYLTTLETDAQTGNGGKTDKRYEQASPRLKALYEAAYQSEKPAIKAAVERFTSMSYADYTAAEEKAKSAATQASASCEQWVKGATSANELPDYAGDAEDYIFPGFALPAPEGNPTKDPSQDSSSNTGSSSMSGIIAISLAILAVLGGLGAWISGLIPGLPKPPMPR